MEKTYVAPNNATQIKEDYYATAKACDVNMPTCVSDSTGRQSVQASDKRPVNAQKAAYKGPNAAESSVTNGGIHVSPGNSQNQSVFAIADAAGQNSHDYARGYASDTVRWLEADGSAAASPSRIKAEAEDDGMHTHYVADPIVARYTNASGNEEEVALFDMRLMLQETRQSGDPTSTSEIIWNGETMIPIISPRAKGFFDLAIHNPALGMTNSRLYFRFNEGGNIITGGGVAEGVFAGLLDPNVPISVAGSADELFVPDGTTKDFTLTNIAELGNLYMDEFLANANASVTILGSNEIHVDLNPSEINPLNSRFAEVSLTSQALHVKCSRNHITQGFDVRPKPIGEQIKATRLTDFVDDLACAYTISNDGSQPRHIMSELAGGPVELELASVVVDGNEDTTKSDEFDRWLNLNGGGILLDPVSPDSSVGASQSGDVAVGFRFNIPDGATTLSDGNSLMIATLVPNCDDCPDEKLRIASVEREGGKRGLEATYEPAEILTMNPKSLPAPTPVEEGKWYQARFIARNGTIARNRTLDASIIDLQTQKEFVVADGIDTHIGNGTFKLMLNGNVRIDDITVGPASGCIDANRSHLGCLNLADIDRDGTVSFADFMILSQNFGRIVDAFVDGDTDGDGMIGFADFLVLSDGWEDEVGTSSVPEPTAGLLAVWSGILLTIHRRSARTRVG